MLGVFVWLVWPAQALGRALVRFLHAVPGAGAATVRVGSGSHMETMGRIAFGQVTPWRGIRSGRFRWELTASGRTLAHGTGRVGSGAYDVVVLQKASGVSLGIYRARGGRPGTSLVRVIHAVPELGAPELELDSKVVVSRLSFTRATPYLSVNPGVHSVSAMKVGESAPLVSLRHVRLRPGVAYSAVVIGSRGQRVRVVTLVDRGAPLSRRSPVAHHAHHPSAAPSGRRMVVVRRGDSLWSIAARRLGPSAPDPAIYRLVIRIWDINAGRIGTGDPNLIFPGTRLLVP